MKLNSTFVKLTGIVLTSPSSFFFQQQLSHLSAVVNRVARTMLLFRQRARQAAAAIHAVASSRTKAAQAEAAHAQKLVVLIC